MTAVRAGGAAFLLAVGATCAASHPLAQPTAGAASAASPAVGLAWTALAAPGFRWDSLGGSTGASALTVYVLHGTYAAVHAPELRRRAVGALRRALTLVGADAYPAHLRVFYVDSRDQMRTLVGAGATGWTAPEAHAVFLVANRAWAPFARHEIVHAVSLTLWGEPRGRAGWLREGLAAAAEDRCGGYTGRAVAARLLAEARLDRAEALVADFDGLARADDLAAYLQAGALVQYLLARYGRAPLARVWHDGATAIPDAYSRSLAALGQEWRAWLAEVPAREQPTSYAALRVHGCG